MDDKKPKPRSFITEAFLAGIRKEGSLAQASKRLSADLDKYEPLPRMSTWSLVCEEIVDTQYKPEYYERVVAELKRRGIDERGLEEMRMFAWETAGWLNFEKMLWDWVSLGEKDIRLALDWQSKEGEITEERKRQALEYLSKYE